MAFPIPASDPGSPLYTQPPDEIRSDTMRGLVERDRFIFATGRRCLFKCGGRVAESGSPVLIHAGVVRSSALVTGNVWVVASGYDCTFTLALGSGSVTETLLATFDTYTDLKTGWITAGADVTYSLTLYGDPGRLFGLAVYEERIPEALLP
jgi:hypothetical protein